MIMRHLLLRVLTFTLFCVWIASSASADNERIRLVRGGVGIEAGIDPHLHSQYMLNKAVPASLLLTSEGFNHDAVVRMGEALESATAALMEAKQSLSAKEEAARNADISSGLLDAARQAVNDLDQLVSSIKEKYISVIPIPSRTRPGSRKPMKSPEEVQRIVNELDGAEDRLSSAVQRTNRALKASSLLLPSNKFDHDAVVRMGEALESATAALMEARRSLHTTEEEARIAGVSSGSLDAARQAVNDLDQLVSSIREKYISVISRPSRTRPGSRKPMKSPEEVRRIVNELDGAEYRLEAAVERAKTALKAASQLFPRMKFDHDAVVRMGEALESATAALMESKQSLSAKEEAARNAGISSASLDAARQAVNDLDQLVSSIKEKYISVIPIPSRTRPGSRKPMKSPEEVQRIVNELDGAEDRLSSAVQRVKRALETA